MMQGKFVLNRNIFFLILLIPLRLFRTSPKEENEINNQIQALLVAGIIKESNRKIKKVIFFFSHFSFKARQENKTVYGLKKINAIIKNDAEPLLRIDSIIDKLSNANYFSTLDLASGLWLLAYTLRNVSPKDVSFRYININIYY